MDDKSKNDIKDIAIRAYLHCHASEKWENGESYVGRDERNDKTKNKEKDVWADENGLPADLIRETGTQDAALTLSMRDWEMSSLTDSPHTSPYWYERGSCFVMPVFSWCSRYLTQPSPSPLKTFFRSYSRWHWTPFNLFVWIIFKYTKWWINMIKKINFNQWSLIKRYSSYLLISQTEIICIS